MPGALMRKPSPPPRPPTLFSSAPLPGICPCALGSSADKTPGTQGPSEDPTVWFKNGRKTFPGNGQRVSVSLRVCGRRPLSHSALHCGQEGAPSPPADLTASEDPGLKFVRSPLEDSFTVSEDGPYFSITGGAPCSEGRPQSFLPAATVRACTCFLHP